MISLPYLFMGVLAGLFVVCVFDPPMRQIPAVPLPNDDGTYRTKTGCIKIQASETPCSKNSVSLNVITGK